MGIGDLEKRLDKLIEIISDMAYELKAMSDNLNELLELKNKELEIGEELAQEFETKHIELVTEVLDLDNEDTIDALQGKLWDEEQLRKLNQNHSPNRGEE